MVALCSVSLNVVDRATLLISSFIPPFHGWWRCEVHPRSESGSADSLLYTLVSSFGYFYMVASWGGYVYIINLVPLHVLALMALGRFTRRTYRVYSVWYAVGTLLSLGIPFVGERPVKSMEHLGAFGTFGLCQLWILIRFLRNLSTNRQQFVALVWRLLGLAAGVVGLGLFLVVASFGQGSWAGRFALLLNPLRSGSSSPLVASVAEHQPTAWSHVWLNVNNLIILGPVGLWAVLRRPSDSGVFLLVFVLTAAYFFSVMVRLALVATPAFAQLAAIGMAAVIDLALPSIFASRTVVQRWARKIFQPFLSGPSGSGPSSSPSSSSSRSGTGSKRALWSRRLWPGIAAGLALAVVLFFYLYFLQHAISVAFIFYASPIIVTVTSGGYNDEYREMYYWMNQNTPERSRMLSWWDYGYHVSSMADRPCIVDNNTNNQTQIAAVGRILIQPEFIALDWLRHYDIDYIFALTDRFGGPRGDDLSKSYWLFTISGNEFPGEGLVQEEYLGPQGTLVTDWSAPPSYRQSLLFHMLYNRWGDLVSDKRIGQDNSAFNDMGRSSEMEPLRYVQEAFSTENLFLRTFRVRNPGELARVVT